MCVCLYIFSIWTVATTEVSQILQLNPSSFGFEYNRPCYIIKISNNCVLQNASFHESSWRLFNVTSDSAHSDVFSFLFFLKKKAGCGWVWNNNTSKEHITNSIALFAKIETHWYYSTELLVNSGASMRKHTMTPKLLPLTKIIIKYYKVIVIMLTITLQ